MSLPEPVCLQVAVMLKTLVNKRNTAKIIFLKKSSACNKMFKELNSIK